MSNSIFELEKDFNLTFMKKCSDEGIDVIQYGPLKFGTIPANMSRMKELQDDTWREVFGRTSVKKEIIEEWLQDPQAWDEKQPDADWDHSEEGNGLGYCECGGLIEVDIDEDDDFKLIGQRCISCGKKEKWDD